MKNKILKSLFVFLVIPVLLVSGCSSKKSDLKTINLSRYIKNPVTCSLYNKTNTTSLSIEDLTAKEPVITKLNQYISFSMQADPVWMYKMYIDYIYFYVYTNIATESQMLVNVAITNLASEDDILNPNDEFTADCSFIPEKDGKFLCEVKVQKTVARATSTYITFDILNSTDVFSTSTAQENGFKWCIYGLEFYAESREYSEQ